MLAVGAAFDAARMSFIQIFPSDFPRTLMLVQSHMQVSLAQGAYLRRLLWGVLCLNAPLCYPWAEEAQQSVGSSSQATRK